MTEPISTHTPFSSVEMLPLTRFPAPATLDVPSGAKPLPNAIASPLGDRAFTSGVLSPAPTIPPVATTGFRTAAGAKFAPASRDDRVQDGGGCEVRFNILRSVHQQRARTTAS